MSNIQEQIDFLNDIKDVTEEFFAAKAVKREDPERYEAAVNAFQERRSFWRAINRLGAAPAGDDTVQASSVDSKAEIKGEVK
jgi:hypothetical protein